MQINPIFVCHSSARCMHIAHTTMAYNKMKELESRWGSGESGSEEKNDATK